MQDDYEVFREPELWLAALVSCGPALLIAAMMIASLIQPQFPGWQAMNRSAKPGSVLKMVAGAAVLLALLLMGFVFSAI
jgi:hypothetical protein